MKRRTIITIAGATAGVAVLAGGGVAIAGNVTDDETPITGDAYDRAAAAALAHTGEGRVTDTEQGDEESYYEVEVTLDDGTEVDVQLDRGFIVVGAEPEDPNEPDDGDGDD